MKKLFISVPMKGRTKENIKNSIDKMHKLAELMFNEELEVVNSYFEDYPTILDRDIETVKDILDYTVPEHTNSSIWYLGESIKLIAQADYFIGIYSDYYTGCDIEASVARRYGIPSRVINIHDYTFFEDAVKLEQDFYSCASKSCGY